MSPVHHGYHLKVGVLFDDRLSAGNYSSVFGRPSQDTFSLSLAGLSKHLVSRKQKGERARRQRRKLEKR